MCTAPVRLISRGKFGILVWARILPDRVLWTSESSRELVEQGLHMSPGMLAGDLQAIASLFELIGQAQVTGAQPIKSYACNLGWFWRFPGRR